MSRKPFKAVCRNTWLSYIDEHKVLSRLMKTQQNSRICKDKLSEVGQV